MGFLLEMPRRQELLVCQCKLAYHDYNAKMVASLFLSIQNWLMVEKKPTPSVCGSYFPLENLGAPLWVHMESLGLVESMFQEM